MTYKVFLAWQSQNKKTANYIKKQLNKATKYLEKQGIVVDVIKSPTQEEPGSPNINDAIWKQIQSADIFIADLSFVSRVRTSNDNVMYELGIADALLGENRTIILVDEHTKIEKLAFDINHKRISPINTENRDFYKVFSDWMLVALRESDKQRFTRRYIVEEFASDLVAIVNYFYRMAFYSDANYSGGFLPPTVEQIEAELGKTKIGLYMVEVDFSKVIKDLEVKVQNLMDFTHPRAIWYLLNLISAIKEYQLYCNSIQYKHLNKINGEKEQYGLYDKKTFFLKPGQGVDEIKGSAFFNDNTVICQSRNCNIVLDKRITVKDDGNFKVKNVDLGNGIIQTCVVTRMATYVKEYRNYLALYIHSILEAINGLLEYCELEMMNLGRGGEKSGIISLKLV
jgi:hypothetical protein